MDFEEILNSFTPMTLTESISLIKTNEPLILKSRLGKNVQEMLDEVCIFEVEEASYNLAPVGYSNDPASNINISRKITSHSVVPPQIYLRDRITASEINKARVAGMNPINMSRQNKATSYDRIVANKQQGLRKLIDRRTEWLFAQALKGKINYTSDTGRVFAFDYKLPNAVSLGGNAWDKVNDPGNPIHDLRTLAKHFRAINNQLAPDLIILGGKAGDAFMNNPHVEEWLKRPDTQMVQLQTNLAKGEATPIARLQNAELFEYSATYENDKGKATPYIEEDYVYLTNSTLWRLFYGAINDFDAGNPPLVTGALFSKMKQSEDGKVMDIFAESHPLPVIVSNSGVVKAKVTE